MGKRGNRTILAIIVLVLTILIANIAYAGCCLNPGDNFCSGVSETVCCQGICDPGLYDQKSCGNTECIEFGCCVATCEAVQYLLCSDPSSFVFADTDCEDNSHPDAEGCLQGCCVELDSSNNIISCDDTRRQKDCLPSLANADDAKLFTGLTENECNDICQQQILPTGSVYGKVAVGNVEKTGATIILGDFKKITYTTTEGYKFEDLPVGGYIITAYYLGYEPVEHTITILQDQEVQQDFDLLVSTTTGELTGEVTDKNTGLGIKNAYVYYNSDGAFTNTYGRYWLREIPVETYDITASASGYHSKTINTEIDPTVNFLNFQLIPLIEPSEPICDNNNCEEGETYENCPQDCPATPTQLGWLTGQVKDSKTTKYLNGVLVQIFKGDTLVDSDTTKKDIFVIPPLDGFYEIFVSPGTYTVKASMQGYYSKPIPNIIISPERGTTLNINLEPLPEECSKGLPPPDLVLSNVKGKTSIILTWTQPCSDILPVDKFLLYRDGILIKEFSKTDSKYKDTEGLEWQKTYEYKLVAISDEEESPTTKTIYTGDSLCKDITDQEFCVNYYGTTEQPLTRRAECTDKNKVHVKEICKDDEICRAYKDKAYCVAPDDCIGLGTDYNEGYFPNILGMYYYDSYSDTTCLENADGIPRNCYFDYYPFYGPYTTVDWCLDCRDIYNCFDYKSEQACEQDSCSFNNCEWYENAYAEFGKGFCYQKDYPGTDYCRLCSKTSKIFENTYCTSELCSKLGTCFSIDGSCAACNLETSKCEDYKDKFSCIRDSDGFNIPEGCNSSIEFEYSDDVCNLGTCKWDGSKCFKDANNDNKADCEEDDKTCQLYNIPPYTIVSIPSYIDSNGDDILFDTDGTKTYYCIDKTFCCPKKEVQENIVTLPNNDFPLENAEGDYYIYYYSTDAYDNTEIVKKEKVYVKTKAPFIDVKTEVKDSSQLTLSDIFVTINVDEDSYCIDALSKGYNEFIGSKISQEITADKDVSATYTSLDDGVYIYSIICEDIYGNSDETEVAIPIDRIKGITVISPTAQEIVKNPVKILLTTTTRNYCRYKDENNNWNFIGTNRGQGVTDLNSGEFKYQIELNLASKDYNYQVECYTTPSLETLYDTTNLVFTVDSLAPTTTAKYESSTGSFDNLKDQPYNSPKIKLECTDSPEHGFGCKETKYCHETLKCEPDTTYQNTFIIDSTEDVYLCYHSSDLGDNIEETVCKLIKIDTQAPELEIYIETDFGSNDLPKISYGTYNIKVVSNEPLYNITEFKFRVNNKIYDNLISKETGNEGATEWNYQILIPKRYDFMNLEGKNSEFIIYAKDLSKNSANSDQITSGKYFEIDTQAPSIKLNPELSQEHFTKETPFEVAGFTDPIEENVKVILKIKDQEKISVTSASGGFSFDLGLDYGQNHIEIYTVDEIGNIGPKTTRTIIFDNKPFEVLAYLPRDDTITSDKRTEIYVVIEDELSEINTNSIKLKINDKEYPYSDLIHSTKNGKLFLTYKPSTDWTDNIYLVTLSGTDTLGTEKSFTWSFEVDTEVPLAPIFEVKDAYYYQPYDLWYTSNKLPEFEITFLEEVDFIDPVILTETGINVNCETLNSKKYTCSLDSNLPEAKHKIEIKAKKQGKDAVRIWPKEFVVDISAPILKFTNPKPVNKPQVTVEGTYEDLSMETDDLIWIKGEIETEKKATLDKDVCGTLSCNTFSAYITLNNNIEKEYTIKAEATDKAGNKGSVEGKIKLDLSVGDIIITVVKSTFGSGIIKTVVSGKEYKTDIDTQDGITIEGKTEEDLILYVYQDGYLLNEPLYSSENEFSFPFTLVNGINNIIFTGTDIAGNPIEDEKEVQIELDKSGPEITIAIK